RMQCAHTDIRFHTQYCMTSRLDPTAAKQPLAIVLGIIEHTTLSRRDTIFAFSELHRNVGAVHFQSRRLQRAARANPGENVDSVRPDRLQLLVAELVDLTKQNRLRAQRLERAHYDFARTGVELQHVKRHRRRNADPTPLADRVIDDAVMTTKHPAIGMDDIAGLRRTRAQPLDDLRVAASRHEADVLAIRFLRRHQPKFARDISRLLFGQIAKREAQEVELLEWRGEQEIALVALLVLGAVEIEAVSPRSAPDIMSGRERSRAEILCGLQHIGELDLLVAGNARHRGLALEIAVGKRAHHLVGEALFVVQHVMRDVQRLGHSGSILDVLPGAARAFAPDGLAMIVELERDADDVIALALEQ